MGHPRPELQHMAGSVVAGAGTGTRLEAANARGYHSQPLPVFLNARNISGDLKDQIEGYTRDQGDGVQPNGLGHHRWPG